MLQRAGCCANKPGVCSLLAVYRRACAPLFLLVLHAQLSVNQYTWAQCFKALNPKP